MTCGESTNAPSCVSSAFIVKGKSTIVQRASWCFLISLITSQKNTIWRDEQLKSSSFQAHLLWLDCLFSLVLYHPCRLKRKQPEKQ